MGGISLPGASHCWEFPVVWVFSIVGRCLSVRNFSFSRGVLLMGDFSLSGVCPCQNVSSEVKCVLEHVPVLFQDPLKVCSSMLHCFPLLLVSLIVGARSFSLLGASHCWEAAHCWGGLPLSGASCRELHIIWGLPYCWEACRRQELLIFGGHHTVGNFSLSEVLMNLDISATRGASGRINGSFSLSGVSRCQEFLVVGRFSLFGASYC